MGHQVAVISAVILNVYTEKRLAGLQLKSTVL